MVILRRPGSTAQIAPRVLLAVLFIVSLAAAGCSSDEELGAGDAATVAAGSVAEITTDGATWVERQAGEVIPSGAVVRAGAKELRLTFRAGTVRLARDAAAAVTTDRLTLERGEALIDSDGALGAAVEDTTVGGAGVYRLSSGLAARVGVYSGGVVVSRPGQEDRAVPALRQLDITNFRLATTAAPLHYDDGDAWDQDLLADAIAFDGEAARLQRGMDLELGTQPQAATFYRQFTAPAVVTVVARTAPETVGQRFGPPSDVLLTVFVAEAVDDPLGASLRRVTGLRTDGAKWGLIAVELDVPSDQVVAAIDRLDNRSLALADRSPEDRTGVAVAAGAAGAAAVGGGVTGDAGEDTGGTGDTGTASAPPATGSPDTGGGGGGDGGDRVPGDDGGENPPPPTDPPGGGEDPKPPPPPPSEDPVEKVVNDVVDGISEAPDGEDVDNGLEVPEVLQPVRDVLGE